MAHFVDKFQYKLINDKVVMSVAVNENMVTEHQIPIAEIIMMEETVKQTDENLNVMQTSYNSGVVTLSDLLEAQALQTETADKLIEAKTQYQLAISTYLQVTGTSREVKNMR